MPFGNSSKVAEKPVKPDLMYAMNTKTMKAAVCTAYGAPEVIQIKQIAQPQAGKNQLLIRVKASAVNSGDVKVRGLKVNLFLRIAMRLIFGWRKPRKSVLGVVYSGVVEQTGEGVGEFQAGDEVFGLTGMNFGAHAEYMVQKHNSVVVKKPRNASFEEAAALLFGAQTAIFFLSKTKLFTQKDLKVLVYGASGAVGTAAVQLAKHYSAKVTAVCSDRNAAFVSELGADRVIAYNQHNIQNLDAQFDVVFDAVGFLKKKDCRHLLGKNGQFYSVAGPNYAREDRSQLELVKHLFEAGRYKAIIDRVYPLDAIVEAHRYVDSGRKRGNVVLSISA